MGRIHARASVDRHEKGKEMVNRGGSGERERGREK